MLGISDPVVDRQAPLGRALGRGLDQRRRQVDASHLRSTRGGQLGDRPGAAREVEPPDAGPRVQPLDHPLVDVGQCLRDPLIGAVAPHHALTLLELLVGH